MNMSDKKKSLYTLYGAGIVLIVWEILHLSLKSFVVPEPFEVLIYTAKSMTVLLRHLGGV